MARFDKPARRATTTATAPVTTTAMPRPRSPFHERRQCDPDQARLGAAVRGDVGAGALAGRPRAARAGGVLPQRLRDPAGSAVLFLARAAHSGGAHRAGP